MRLCDENERASGPSRSPEFSLKINSFGDLAKATLDRRHGIGLHFLNATFLDAVSQVTFENYYPNASIVCRLLGLFHDWILDAAVASTRSVCVNYLREFAVSTCVEPKRRELWSWKDETVSRMLLMINDDDDGAMFVHTDVCFLRPRCGVQPLGPRNCRLKSAAAGAMEPCAGFFILFCPWGLSAYSISPRVPSAVSET